jgi:hypothetical protein
MENVTNQIVKAAVKNDRCEVTFEENFTESNYSNNVTKKCSQIVHADLKKALDRLKIHMVIVCEQKEAEELLSELHRDDSDEAMKYFEEFDTERLANYLVTGFSIGGSDENQGVTLIGQKLLASGQVLNLISPFVKYEDNDGYEFAAELSSDIEAACYEVEQYLFGEKWGIKQAQIDFDSPGEIQQLQTLLSWNSPGLMPIAANARTGATGSGNLIQSRPDISLVRKQSMKRCTRSSR